MGFLCANHREYITNDPHRAQVSWNKTLYTARKLVNETRWDEAVIYYGNALEISDIMMSQELTSASQERYLRTAVELMHALRNSHHQYNALAFFQMILDRLEQDIEQFNSQKQLKPLKDVAFEPLPEVNRWMTMWHELLSEQPQVWH